MSQQCLSSARLVVQDGEYDDILSKVMSAMEDRMEADAVGKLVVELRRQKQVESRLRQQISHVGHELRITKSLLRDTFLRSNACLQALTSAGIVSADDIASKTEGLLVKYGLDPEYQGRLSIALDRRKPGSEPGGVKATDINCRQRRAACGSACCRLSFVLRPEEVQVGVVKWDPGKPFWNARGEDGYCVHYDRRTGECTIYDRRPLACKQYTCRQDKRIWLDFDAGTAVGNPAEVPDAGMRNETHEGGGNGNAL